VDKSLRAWLLLALLSSLLLPWHQQEAGLWAGDWLSAWPGDQATASAAWLVAGLGHVELLPLVLLPVLAGLLALARWPRPALGGALAALASAGLLWLAWFAWGAAGTTQPALGWGALAFGTAALFVLSTGAAWRGACRGDVFVCGVIALLVALVGLFVMFPVLKVLAGAFEQDGQLSLGALWSRTTDARIWSVGCLAAACAAAWPGTRCSSALPRRPAPPCWALPSR
jgi:iron(III) transport system permease protein